MPDPVVGPAAEDVVARFAGWARRTPNAPAVRGNDGALTYAALERRSAAFAARLLCAGACAEQPVGVLLERGAEAVAALLGVMRAGAAYLPLDPALPPARTQAMLAEAGAALLVTSGALCGQIRGFGGAAVLAEAVDDAEGDGFAPADADPRTLAYVIFTSGSTGRPRGVGVERRHLARYAAGVAARLGVEEGASWALMGTLAADLGHTALFGALTGGGCLHVVPADTAADSDAFAAYLQRHRVDCVKAVPSHLDALLACAHPERVLPRRALVLGGEALPRRLAAAVRSLAPSLGIFNHYGPTETTVGVLAQSAEEGSADGPTIPLGLPLPGARAYVLDLDGHPAPAGGPGELCVGGGTVARGYLGRPAATAERFVPDPFASEPGARMYRTGDRARLGPDGRVEFLGRMDRQVKVRGWRVEPGEVEAALREHPAVRHVVVEPRDGGRLVAYVVPLGGAPGAGELTAHAAAHLPEYRVPAAFILMEALPLTANGKVDRGALPAEDAAAAAYLAPRSAAEARVARVWEEVLGVERAGALDSFFDLGGHSLLAMRAASRLSRAFGREVPMRLIFDGATVEAVAARLEASGERAEASPPPAGDAPVAEFAARVPAGREEGWMQAPPVVPAPRGGTLPLSFAQQRLWMLDRLEPGSAAYNMTAALRLRGALDDGALARAVAEIVRRHEVLRTVFPAGEDGAPAPLVLPPGRVRLARIGLGALPAARREAELARLAAEEAGRPFHLAAGPLLRVTLVRLAEDDAALLFTLHHIAGDAWSTGILVREVSALYGAFTRGLPSPLAEPALQYADFTAWQRASVREAGLDGQLGYWRAALAGAPARLELPAERPRGAAHVPRGGVATLAVPPAEADGVRALARAEGATLFMVLLAAFQAVLGRWSGQDDVVVGAPVAGRTLPETEAMPGCFLNTLALRTRLDGDPSFRALLGRAREAALGAFAHQDLPFERLLEALRPERELGQTPVFQVLLNLLNVGGDAVDLPGVRVEEIAPAGEHPKFDLTLYASEQAGALHLRLVYDAARFGAGQMAELLGHVAGVLRTAAHDPGTRLSALPLPGARERQAAGRRLRGVRPGVPFARWEEADVAQSIPARFAAQAGAHGNRQALSTPSGRMTYAELDAASNRAAHALLAHAAPGGRVALLLEHDAAMVVGMLGALKAGAAYVPLDPLHPGDRLAYVLEDSGACALLTSAANGALAERLAGGRIPVVYLAASAGMSAGDPGISTDPGALAYLLYTSGSTGRPKGVMQSHRNVLHHVRAYTHNLGIRPADRLTLFSSCAFDAAVMDVYGALLNGAALCTRSLKAEGLAGVAEWMRTERITLFHSTPTVYRAVVESLAPAERFPGVRAVVLGGEEARGRDLEAFRRHFPETCVFVNGLGPTESTLALAYAADPVADAARASLPVGYPAEATDVALLTPLGEQPAVWGAGEIVVRSRHVALGYWNLPEATEAAFSGAPGGVRQYRTGDLGRWLPDGGIESLGRRDFQVKVRGHRVELAEVEACLLEAPGVSAAVVAARADADGNARLVAWVVPAAGRAADAAALRGWLAARLPDYMVPAAVMALDALPHTPTGKVDRLALPEPPAAAPADAVPPSTPVEEVLAAIWAEVLGREAVGVTDDFFALGGHSLLAMQVLSRVRAVFQVELPMRALFEHPTVAALSSDVDGACGGAGVAREIAEAWLEVQDLSDTDLEALVAAV